MEISGVIRSIEDFNVVVNETQMGRLFDNYTEVYRGQSKESYQLKPNLARKAKSVEDLVKLEKEIIEEFKKRVIEAGKINRIMLSNNEERNEWEWICQAQHYGLPTRFMDWTINAQMALYFAVGDSKDDDSDGQFWILLTPLEIFKTDGEEIEYFKEHPFAKTESILLNAAFYWNDDHDMQIGERRQEGQFGRFFISSQENSLLPMEDNPTLNKHLRKYVIPKEFKALLRDYLLKLNYNYDSVYIEQDETINNIVSELRAKYGV